MMFATGMEGATIQGTFNLDDNQTPAGWTLLRLWGNINVSSGRFNAFPVDANGHLIAPLPANLGPVERVEINWDGNVEHAFWGMGTTAGVRTQSGSAFYAGCGHAHFNRPGVLSVQTAGYLSFPDYPEANKLFNVNFLPPLQFGSFRYSLVIERGHMTLSATVIGTGAEVFNINYDHPSIEIENADAVFFNVGATSGPTAWLDNLSYRVTTGENCSEQLAEANQSIDALSQQLAAQQAANANLQTQLAASQGEVASLTEKINSIQTQIDRIANVMRTEFRDNAFMVPGAGTVAQITALANVVVGLSHGQMQHVYRGLAGN